jgi:hypothetical protein
MTNIQEALTVMVEAMANGERDSQEMTQAAVAVNDEEVAHKNVTINVPNEIPMTGEKVDDEAHLRKKQPDKSRQ